MEANGGQPSPAGNQAPPPPRPRVRPHITLKITPPGQGGTTPPLRPLSYYYGSPLVGIPLTPVPLGTDQHGIPISMVHAYPTKASEFMFKQFEGFRDFTMNTAKSGLSLGEKTAFWMYNRMRVLSRRWFTHIFLLIVVGGYCMLGAVMFVAVEGGHERKHLDDIREQRHALLRTIRQRWEQMGPLENQRDEVEWLGGAVQAIREYELQVVDHYKHGIQDRRDKPIWNYWNAVFFCGTTITTIGYGHISPSTTTGRALTIAYAIFGIPMFLILLADFGKLFTRGMKFGWAFVRRLYYTGSCRTVRRTAPVQEVMKGVQLVYDMAMFRRPSELPPGVEGLPLGVDGAPPLPPRPPYSPTEPPSTPALSNFAIDDEFNLPISVAIVVLLGYIFCGATVFYWWETWGFFESFYFVFISMSTIGFGDFVPQNHMYMMASIVYLVFGLALTSMCINVVQEKLSDSFRQASAKIGATIGLRMAEEEGATIMPPGVAPVEMPEVHLAARHQAPSAT